MMGSETTRQRARTLLVRWGPVLLWMGVIFVFSAQPTLPRHPNDTIELLTKKSGHLVEYAMLALLLRRALAAPDKPTFWDQKGFLATLQAGLWPWVIAVLYAASDEFHQWFVPGRAARIVDVLIDSVGACLALILADFFTGRR